MPVYWYDHAAAVKKDREDGTTIQERIVADKKPEFMTYRYPAEMAEYNSYKIKTECSAERQFGIELQEIINKEELTDEEATFLKWYYKKMPVGTAACAMNRICWAIEDGVAKIKDRWKANCKKFDYNIYRSDSEYCKKDYAEACKLVDQYKDELEKCSMMAKRDHLDQDDLSLQKEHIMERFCEDCYALCNDSSMLCNILLDATYGRNRGFPFVWAACGEAIIENLLEKNSRIVKYLSKSPTGDFEYGGNHYDICFQEVPESGDYS